MAHYQAMGSIPPKRHTQHRRPAGRGKQGELYYEELMGEEGFSSDSSLLYHRGVPSAIVDSQVWELPDLSTHAQPPAEATPPQAARPVRPEGRQEHRRRQGRRLVLGNGDVRISYVVAGGRASPYYRNAVGDECVYVESRLRRGRDGLRRAALPRPATT